MAAQCSQAKTAEINNSRNRVKQQKCNAFSMQFDAKCVYGK